VKFYYENIPNNRERSIIKLKKWMETTMEKMCKDQMLLCILQTSPYLWSCIGIKFFERDPNSLQYELWAWDVHEKATNVSLFLCVFEVEFLLVEIMEWIQCLERSKKIPQARFFGHLVWWMAPQGHLLALGLGNIYNQLSCFDFPFEAHMCCVNTSNYLL
jgi:hypothetical protein